MNQNSFALQNLINETAEILIKQGLILASAESCTGGWLAKCCTDKAGSSKWFDCGIISYSNNSKKKLLNVATNTLDHFGAVSEQTAIEMSQGILHNSAATISVAITGIAGPDGGTKQKPVGSVYFSWSVKNSITVSQYHHFSGDRNSIRYQAIIVALQGIIKNARDSASYMG